MQTDPTALIALTQRHPEETRRQFARNLAAAAARSNRASSPPRWTWPRLGETLASGWISVACAWHSLQAGQAPSRC
mgnify:CR=1 FL=1